MTDSPTDILPDRDIKLVIGRADFGSRSVRSVINEAVLKIACGYRNGSTATEILFKLDLMLYNTLTARGRKLLWALHGKGEQP